MVKIIWNKLFKNKLYSFMIFGEIFDSLVKKVNREDSKIIIEESNRSIMFDFLFKINVNINNNSFGSMSLGLGIVGLLFIFFLIML